MLSRLLPFIKTRNQKILAAHGKLADRAEQKQKALAKSSPQDLARLAQDFIVSGHAFPAKGLPDSAVLASALAICAESARRATGLCAFREQFLGAVCLLDGKIAEMKTGEGKTLVGAIAAGAYALFGGKTHIATPNEYLAARDASFFSKAMAPIGLRAAASLQSSSLEEKQGAYLSDAVYSSHSELGFDHLRDHMAMNLDERVQGPLAFAIVDEADNILIDEARTPLIISQPGTEDPELKKTFAALAPSFFPASKEPDPETQSDGDFWADEKRKHIQITEEGMKKAETLLFSQGLIPSPESLWLPEHLRLVKHLEQALCAMSLYRRDVDYAIVDGKILIVDSATGRLMEGRRWSDGLHGAVEAKEYVVIEPETHTAASISFQSFFALYGRLSGLTGTADTQARELHETYGLETVVIPTHKPMVRDDLEDLVYARKEEKIKAVCLDVAHRNKKGQPILIGTPSIEASEELSKALEERGIAHRVLNARKHQEEAQIIAQAGRVGAITISTNMAGRGTDILLGGNLEVACAKIDQDGALDQTAKNKAKAVLEAQMEQERAAVLALGGLHVIATERHEARRIDHQLRGRSGRQGDPGSSQFFISLDDPLMRLFAGPMLQKAMKALNAPADEALCAPILNRSIARAQAKVEDFHFGMRKELLRYDSAPRQQRQAIYSWREKILESADPLPLGLENLHERIAEAFNRFWPADFTDDQVDFQNLEQLFIDEFFFFPPIKAYLDENPEAGRDDALELSHQGADAFMEAACSIAPDLLSEHARMSLLRSIDSAWRDQLDNIDALRKSIHLRAYAQKEPLREFERDAFDLFERMAEEIKSMAARALCSFGAYLIQSRQEAEAQGLGAIQGNIHLDGLEPASSILEEEPSGPLSA